MNVPTDQTSSSKDLSPNLDADGMESVPEMEPIPGDLDDRHEEEGDAANYREVSVPADYPAVTRYSSDELRAMSQAELVSFAVRLQMVNQQLDSDYRILRWELDDSQKNISFFSRAAKLAHKLNVSDVETIANIAVFELPDYLNCRFAALYIYDPELKTIELHRSTVKTPDNSALHRRNDASHFLVRLFFHQAEPFVVRYVNANTLLVVDTEETLSVEVPDEWHRLIGDNLLVFPLRAKQNDRSVVLGGLIIGDSSKQLVVNDAEISMLFSDLLSSSLYNAMLVQQLNEMTILDPLTQIYNRRHLLSQLNHAMVTASRYRRPLSIAMLDIDNFKQFNDLHGHLCGDMVLRDIGDLLKTIIRFGIDLPARFSGEEFIIIMPSINIKQAVMAGDRIRREIKKHTVLCDKRELSVTCSVGLAEYSSGETIERFIGRVEAALYLAKRHGRDRAMADDPSESGTEPPEALEHEAIR